MMWIRHYFHVCITRTQVVAPGWLRMAQGYATEANIISGG